jgi:hypothetical protein
MCSEWRRRRLQHSIGRCRTARRSCVLCVCLIRRVRLCRRDRAQDGDEELSADEQDELSDRLRVTLSQHMDPKFKSSKLATFFDDIANRRVLFKGNQVCGWHRDTTRHQIADIVSGRAAGRAHNPCPRYVQTLLFPRRWRLIGSWQAAAGPMQRLCGAPLWAK